MSRLIVIVVFTLLPVQVLRAQPSTAERAIPEIGEEPRTIDPTTLLAGQLGESATRDFSASSLRELVEWLQHERELVVLVEKNALADLGLSPAEPLSDWLVDAPIYLLLNRLSSLGLTWYYEDEILHITSPEWVESRSVTLPYNVGDLLNQDYDLDKLIEVISSTVAPESWETVGGPSVLNALGDVLFVHQTHEVQREVAGLLAALPNHARQTFVNDPTQHVTLREKLDEQISVDFLDTPLVVGVEELAELAGIDIRLDMPALRDIRVREREPVSLKLADRKLETVLRAIVVDLNLTWILRDGVLWITSSEEAETSHKIAVYDVRDLCRDAAESDALIEAVTSQTEPSSWDIVGGAGAIEYAKPGTLVVAHEERIHMQVLRLLAAYRLALRSSERRPVVEEDPNEVVTVYYQMHTNIASDLSEQIKLLVRPESWKSASRPEAPGEVLYVSSRPSLAHIPSKIVRETDATSLELLVARAVLIIQQTRSTHTEERTHDSRVSLEIAVDYVIFRVDTSMSLVERVAKDAAQMLGSAWKTLGFSWFRCAGSRKVNRIG